SISYHTFWIYYSDTPKLCLSSNLSKTPFLLPKYDLLSRNYAKSHSMTQKTQIKARGTVPPHVKRDETRAGGVHRPGIAKSHALEVSTAQKSKHPTRWIGPPPRNCKISRAGSLHRSGIALSRALEVSIAQE